MAVDEVLHDIDTAMDGRCPCGAEPAPGSAYCSDDCRPTHIGPDTDAPGSGLRTAARWRPDLVAAFDEDDWSELARAVDGDGLTHCVYRHRTGDSYLYRLDDGHRFVALPVDAATFGDEDASTEVWHRLERELADSRRLDPAPGPDFSGLEQLAAAYARSMEQAAEGFRAFSEAFRSDARVLWMANPPADPEAPILAELDQAMDLTPYVTSARLGAEPTHEWRDETHAWLPPEVWREAVEGPEAAVGRYRLNGWVRPGEERRRLEVTNAFDPEGDCP